MDAKTIKKIKCEVSIGFCFVFVYQWGNLFSYQ